MTKKQMSSLHYQIPIDSIPLNIAVYQYADDDFVFVDFNTMAEQTEGLAKNDLLGKKLCDVFPGVKSFGLYDVLLRVHEHGGHETFDDAHYKDERISGWRKNEIIKLPNGNVMAMYEDLTQVKQLEEENHKHLKQLEESEEKLRTIAENTLMGIFIYEGEHYSYVNDAFVSLIGYSKEELYTMKIWEIIDKPYQSKVREIAEQRIQGIQFPYTYQDIKLITKSGQPKTMRASTKTIIYHGHFAGMGTIIDITDIKETKEQLKILGQAIEQTDDLVKIISKKGEILFVNDSVINHSGYTRSELIGSHTRIFKSGYHDSSFYIHLWKTVTSGKIYRDTFVNKKKNGSLFYEEEAITPIFDENGKIEYYVSTGKDISKRVELEDQLRDAEKLYHTLFDLSPVGILVIDPDTGKAIEFNSITHKVLGYSAEEFAQLRVTDYEAVETPEDTKAHIEALKDGKSEIFETQHKTKNGDILDMIISVQLITIKEKPYLFSVYQDITKQKKYEQFLEVSKLATEKNMLTLEQHSKVLEEYAFLDPLTHLPNRRKFDKVFDAEWRRALRSHQPLSICMIDIDFFKGYNDSLGHDEGDICLVQVASAISKSSLRSGELAARFGGEEFIVLLPNCDEKNAYLSAEHIRQSVEKLEIKHPDSKVSSVVTVSIGCATCYATDKILDKQNLIKRADEALYRSKKNGRNRIYTIEKNSFSEMTTKVKA